MAPVTLERVAEFSALATRLKPPLEQTIQTAPQVVAPKKRCVELRTSQIINEPGGIVYMRETLERQTPLRTEYWFSVPPRGVSLRCAYPRFKHLFKEGIPLMRVPGLNKEPQLYLETDIIGQPLIHSSFFREPEGFKERYY